MDIHKNTAWLELDAIPVPQTTFVDEKGLPLYTVLSDGSKLYPLLSRVGQEIDYIDESEVGEDLQSRRGKAVIVWDGLPTTTERGTRLRTSAEDAVIAAGYDDAVNTFGSTDPADARHIKTSETEAQVWELRQQELSYNAIATRLNIAVETVSWHLRMRRRREEGIIRAEEARAGVAEGEPGTENRNREEGQREAA